MVLHPQGIKEVDSAILEQKVSSNVDVVFRLHALSKRLKQKIKRLDASHHLVKKYKSFINNIRAIIDRIIVQSLGDDESLSEDASELKYEFIGDSQLRINDETLEISEDESNDAHDDDSESEFKYTNVNNQAACQISDTIFAPITIFDRLYIHQKKGLKWLAGLHHRGHGGILADEMGLGKTITILSFFNALIFSTESKTLNLEGGLHVLVVCPTTLISQWKDEMGKWAPLLKPIVFHGALGSFGKRAIFGKSQRVKYKALITSYETLRVHIETINACHWSYVVLDEGQKIRNPDAAITLAVKTLGTPHRILLSGSPIQNNLVEFWSLLDFVAPGHLGTLPLFTEQFVEPIMRSTDVCNNSAAYNCALRLRELVHPFIQRNLKSEFTDCLRLPKKTEHIIMCNLTRVQYQVYIALLKNVINVESVGNSNLALAVKTSISRMGSKMKSSKFLLLLTLLRKVCNHPDLVLKEHPKDFGNVERSSKLMIALDIISNWEVNGHKILVFSQTIQMLNIIYANLATRYGACRIARIDGDISIKRRSGILDAFEKGEDVFVLLLTTRVGGVGLNLTCADRILIFDPDWNPMTDSQARERSYRIGQNRDVVIYRLISAHTVEEKIYHRQIYKFYLSERILTDPRVMGFRFLPASDLLSLPPKPAGPGDTGEYMHDVEKQLKSIDFEMEIRQLNNTNGIYQRSSDVAKCVSEENPILQSIFAHHEIEGVIKHDDIENRIYANVDQDSSVIADKAIQLLKRSLKERSAYDISVPTWTGENGQAAAPVCCNGRKVPKGGTGNSVSMLQNLRRKTHGPDVAVIRKDMCPMINIILDYFRRAPKLEIPTGEVCNPTFRTTHSRLPVKNSSDYSYVS
ncbi:SNF2 domain-containing protein / helicase domain-containing protein, putative [Babesia bigemina]|uniref:SNF2 domain-containing protein / helicase domain-containing protein, putative n=1 Tax=Babesia bigemina TaxID=5866 RepID=A0A061D0Q4_BABBI|nr:SNF2 domain-containing protein / helicase domain-containing protein, putative [Babesia bigemina]CDR94228.1 SNF2 domain-containing protein / helicase domain-containing protein, putative [Babesia bigemina]|eukprot:XP_012766414.1 SNF2 domain-containing protein / helicase domain-containing protein, putative [Babesia bigemina]